ncbi:MAG: MBL fold metallo-hydrolase [Clostridiales bacterium]|jgi:flavorubredoxin|nr:MBL fold metallo-hydrolase [Clostridiales bacterium]
MGKHEIIAEKEPVEIAEGIYWVGYSDRNIGLHCNPYLIIEGEEAVLIDGGSRDSFSEVMIKILRTGLNPKQITRLIYQHYDPDLCGSLPHLESIINNDNLRIISHNDNNIFINYYSSRTEKIDIRDLNNHFDFATGRRLEFYETPYCHQTGSFVTYDTQTKTLFSSDLFGSFDDEWTLFLELDEACRKCPGSNTCALKLPKCCLSGIKAFHQRVMTSSLASAHTLKTIASLDIDIVAPQHGSIIASKEDIKALIRHLQLLKNVGIDYLLSEESK